jgi:hypothetical protein
VSGTLKRLYVKSASGGACAAPLQGDPSITARSAALGAPILPGDTRYYQVYYRDSAAAFCPPETFNATNGRADRVVMNLAPFAVHDRSPKSTRQVSPGP